jgi:hypothetical protein
MLAESSQSASHAGQTRVSTAIQAGADAILSLIREEAANAEPCAGVAALNDRCTVMSDSLKDAETSAANAIAQMELAKKELAAHQQLRVESERTKAELAVIRSDLARSKAELEAMTRLYSEGQQDSARFRSALESKFGAFRWDGHVALLHEDWTILGLHDLRTVKIRFAAFSEENREMKKALEDESTARKHHSPSLSPR